MSKSRPVGPKALQTVLTQEGHSKCRMRTTLMRCKFNIGKTMTPLSTVKKLVDELRVFKLEKGLVTRGHLCL